MLLNQNFLDGDSLRLLIPKPEVAEIRKQGYTGALGQITHRFTFTLPFRLRVSRIKR